VSGIRILALEGGLTTFASGEPAACARIEPVLLGFSRTSTYFGPFGCGMKVKLVGNLLSLVHNCAAAEAMVLGMKSGLDTRTQSSLAIRCGWNDSLKNISKPARAQIPPIIPESRSAKILSKHWMKLQLKTQR
jgi:3-hydroxyisobutyrate dehydrogenase-like beta-hydroxyacid dehydrogenase